MATVVTAVHLPRKYFRAQVRKEKRKKKRQAAAQLRDAQRTVNESEDDDNQDVEENEVETEQEQCEQDEERTSLQAKAAWLERESLAQAEFEKQRKIAEAIKQKEMEERKLIQKEWEEQQKKEDEEKEKKDQELESVLQQLDHELGNKKESSKGSKEWRNPEAPASSQPASNQPGRAEKKEEICSFFLKTGACRFKERCSRTHPYPEQGTTLMIPGMYTNFGLGPDFKDEYDADVGLECDEESAYLNFHEFYEDVLPEFREYGEVVQLKVCRNWEPHLRGNVYVQYRSEEEAAKAAQVFAGRFYGGKQLDPRYCPVSRWKPAICGLFHRDKCPRGKHCNFLHVFHNPRGEFSDADQDRPPRTPRHRHDDQRRRGDRPAREFRRRSRSRSRLDYRRSRRRSRSRSRERSSRRYSHRRSRSRERDIRRSRSRDRSNRSRSRERRRSSSPDRNGRRIRDLRRDRSRSGSGEESDRRSRSGSRERQLPDSSSRKTKDRKYDHNRSRSRERRRKRSSSLEDNDVRSKVKKERRSRSRSRERTNDKVRSRIKERGKKKRSSSVEQDSDGSESHSGSDHEPCKPILSKPLNLNGLGKEEGSPRQDFKYDRLVESQSFKDEEKYDVSNDKFVPIDSKLTSAVHRKKKGKSKNKSRHKRHSSSERKKKRRRHQKSESSNSSSAEEGEKEDLTVKEKEMRERIQKRHQSVAKPKACDIETGEGQSNDSSDDEALRLAAMRTMGQKKLNR